MKLNHKKARGSDRPVKVLKEKPWCKSGTTGTQDPSQSLKVGPSTHLKF